MDILEVIFCGTRGWMWVFHDVEHFSHIVFEFFRIKYIINVVDLSIFSLCYI